MAKSFERSKVVCCLCGSFKAPLLSIHTVFTEYTLFVVVTFEPMFKPYCSLSQKVKVLKINSLN